MNIIENSTEHLADFIRLNEEWISQHFTIEEADRKLAANPYAVVENGGYIFCLVSGNETLGTCALFNDGDGVFELARMAVSPRHQRNGYSNLLMEHSLAKLKAVSAAKVYLISNTKLAAAIGLYKKYGFKTVFEGPHPVYSRANTVMERLV